MASDAEKTGGDSWVDSLNALFGKANPYLKKADEATSIDKYLPELLLMGIIGPESLGVNAGRPQGPEQILGPDRMAEVHDFGKHALAKAMAEDPPEPPTDWGHMDDMLSKLGLKKDTPAPGKKPKDFSLDEWDDGIGEVTRHINDPKTDQSQAQDMQDFLKRLVDVRANKMSPQIDDFRSALGDPKAEVKDINPYGHEDYLKRTGQHVSQFPGDIDTAVEKFLDNVGIKPTAADRPEWERWARKQLAERGYDATSARERGAANPEPAGPLPPEMYGKNSLDIKDMPSWDQPTKVEMLMKERAIHAARGNDAVVKQIDAEIKAIDPSYDPEGEQ